MFPKRMKVISYNFEKKNVLKVYSDFYFFEKVPMKSVLRIGKERLPTL